MAANRGRRNKATEWRLRARLVASGISGWRMNAADIEGKPDFAFDKARVVVFVDGCFWHGCPLKCRNIPAANHDFWLRKITGNKKRDRLVNRRLKRSGWRVLRFWEHDLRRRPEDVLQHVKSAVAEPSDSPS